MEKFGDTPGVFYNVPEEVYHALKIPSNSALKKFTRLPALYELEYLKATEEDQETKAHFQQGKLFEIFMLEPERLESVKTFDGKQYGSKDYEAAVAENPGCLIVSKSDYEEVARWAACAQKRFGKTQNAVQVSCIADFVGIEGAKHRFKFRCDEVDFEARIIYDYKLMADASPSEFEKSAWQNGYDTQAALYCLGMDILEPGDLPWRFAFRVQEKHSFGYDDRFTAEYWFDDQSMDSARSHVKMQLQVIETDNYKGYTGGVLSTVRFFSWGRK